MGELSDGEKIAVKKLRYHFIQVDDVQFNNELHILTKIQHPNIVQFVGYCYATRHESVEINGNFVLAEIHERALCFEYLQNGSLKKHLTEVSCGLDWKTRYKIIKGVCEGLNYLHNGSIVGNPIYHLDLKPDNLLLDENMVPKIADFGLSRLFGTTQSHITKNFIGTRGYMPPEYVDVLKISNKFDVFSLGAVIIDIMTGPSSCRFDYAETSSSQEFVNLVQENWKRRLQATPRYTTQEVDCLKVKTCIEIAFRCMQTERAKRPTIAVVLDTLNYIDTVGKSSSVVDQARLLRLGLWGGNGGRRQDIKTAPHQLKSVTIYSSIVIDALEFSYTDRNGQYHAAGPWGSDGTSPNKIQLHPSESLVELCGTVGPFDGIPNVITSLTLVTNAGKYGPFGQGNGTPFHITVQSNGHIAGFFGRADQYVNAVGVYTNQERDGQLAKIGPWGGDGGRSFDIKMVPHRLHTLMIHSADVIESIAFSYVDLNGKHHTAGPWGGRGGEYHEIELDPAEFLVKVSGTSGPFDGIQKLITSLTFVTNAGRSFGPFGKQHGTPFDIPVHSQGCIVGFFVCGGKYLDAIGIYARPI
ncbi:unnamed protein product [Urochloa humidicola]